MRMMGIILIVVGILWGVFAFNIETSIEVGGESYGSGLYKVSIPKTRVNNLGLMNEKQNNIYGAGITLIIGVILFVFGSRKEDQNSQVKEEAPLKVEKDDDERYKVSFKIKDKNSWDNIRINLFNFYKEHNIQNLVTDKEFSWMLIGEEGTEGYIQATLKENTITIESFKLIRPNIDILNAEIKQKKENNQEIDSTSKLIELSRLLDKGLITKEEFEVEKKKIF